MVSIEESGSPGSLNHQEASFKVAEQKRLGWGGDLARLLQAYEFILSGHEDLSPAAGDGQKSVFLSLSHSQSTSAPNNGGKGKRRLT